MAAHDDLLAESGDDPDVPGPGLEGLVEVGVVDDRTVSYRLVVSPFPEGAANPITFVVAATVAVADGRELELADVGLDARCQSLRDLLVVLGEAQEPPLDQADLLADPGYELREWSLVEEGLAFHFDEYELGPGSAGAPTIVVTYDGLAEIAPSSWLAPDTSDEF